MWRIVDSGRATGSIHMEADRAALAALNGSSAPATLRFFQWERPTVSYGYLLNESDVKSWAAKNEVGNLKLDFVQRPTGGGVVKHDDADLSFSLAWKKDDKFFSSNPRTCYGEIHARCIKALEKSGAALPLVLHVTCKQTPKQFSACFEQPVCNDVMRGDEKIVGGALRVGRQATLYQGTIKLPPNADLFNLKRNISEAFQS